MKTLCVSLETAKALKAAGWAYLVADAMLEARKAKEADNAGK